MSFFLCQDRECCMPDWLVPTTPHGAHGFPTHFLGCSFKNSISLYFKNIKIRLELLLQGCGQLKRIDWLHLSSFFFLGDWVFLVKTGVIHCYCLLSKLNAVTNLEPLHLCQRHKSTSTKKKILNFNWLVKIIFEKLF